MYSLNKPVSELRTKIRQEFERRRFVNQLRVVDVLIQKSHAEYQVGIFLGMWDKIGGFRSIEEMRDPSLSFRGVLESA